MIVAFVSECQKNSLKLTRQVLDAYAHRIGQRTWQAIMTEQGLQAVRTRLSQTARKTTAVACHRMHGTRRTELVWIVGNRRRFDNRGNVAVHSTRRNLLREHDENDWRYLSLLKPIVAIAGLFHDFGKAWDPFQSILRKPPKRGSRVGDPVRHEWISLLLFLAFVDGRPDEEWIDDLTQFVTLSPSERQRRSKMTQDKAGKFATSQPYPFDAGHSSIVGWIAWLIVSHHRLPSLDCEAFGESVIRDEQCLLQQISVGSGFEKMDAANREIKKHWKFKHHLPWMSQPWCKVAARWGRKMQVAISQFDHRGIEDLVACQRLMLTLSRMVLMLGDHQYSSQPEDSTWSHDWPPFANTYRRVVKQRGSADVVKAKGAMRQKLDEHLVRVTEAAVDMGHLLPAFESQLQIAQDVRALRKPSPRKFQWQNRAVDELRRWRHDHRIESMGFFAINLASTGKGKTLANAKIMDAISPRGLRYSLALGLRTLTLQTGDEYREKLRLDENELAILIGSAAVRVLHQQRAGGGTGVSSLNAEDDSDYENAGAESGESLSDGYEFAFEDAIPDDAISTALQDRKSRQLLKCPLLVCTIDHLMPAVENTRGGKQILPMLRMLSADLVIDEVDDFDHSDMPAIARLVHLAGMLGRKVMISSATIPPAVAEGLFHAYRSGWSQFAKFRNRQPVVTGFWVDEYAAKAERIADDAEFKVRHAEFVAKRVRQLNKEPLVARRALVRPLAELTPIDRRAATQSSKAIDASIKQGLQTVWFSELGAAAIDLHRLHATVDRSTGKRVSVGVIRVANVEPCIDLASHLLECELPDDIELRVMPYHARQVLLLRSAQESYLDKVLNRKGDRSPCNDPVIREHLQRCEKPHVMFVLVASPVAEVGRDHDFDWAVIEPSSIRSVVQMAGRVMRHRVPAPGTNAPNVVLPELNLKAFASANQIVYHHPGFEGGNPNRGGGYCLNSKCLGDLVDTNALASRLDATSRIDCPTDLQPEAILAHLEHSVLRNVMTQPDFRPAFVKGWTSCGYYLTDLAQHASRFRESDRDSVYKLHIDDDGKLAFRHVDPDTRQSDGPHGKTVAHLSATELDEELTERLWLSLDYAALIETQQTRLGKSRRQACEFLGELRIRDDDGARPFLWNPVFGARKA